MEVNVTLFSFLSEEHGSQRRATLPEEGAQVWDVLRMLELADHEVEVVIVNGNLAQFDTKLSPGDRVSLIPFMSGG